MANQNAILRALNKETGQTFAIRVVLVDSDGGAATFTDYGAGTVYTAPADIEIIGITGQGTTAPATATAFQFAKNGNDLSAYAVGAAAFDPTSRQEDRIIGIGSLNPIAKGSAVQITGRA